MTTATGVLPHRALGTTGLAVAPLSLGTVKLGRSEGVKYPTPVKIPDDREARALLNAARDLGINLLDTAPAYGTSETRLGHLLKADQDAWHICTKVGEEFTDGRSYHDFSPAHCRASIDRSLMRLGRERLDLVLIHSNGEDVAILEDTGLWAAVEDLRTAGKIGAIGLSHKTLAGAERALALGADVMMATLNRTHTEDAPVIARAAAGGCGVLIKKALESGHGSAADLTWVAAQPGVHTIVIGTTSIEHLHANAAAVAAAT